MIKEHGILYSAPMVKALLKGIKTHTRRLPGIKNTLVDGKHVTQKKWDSLYLNFDTAVVDSSGLRVKSKITQQACILSCLYHPGDLLWVRETFFKPPEITEQMLKDGADTWEPYYYAADCDKQETEQLKEWEWQIKPGIHMPKEAARIWLQVERTFPERIQNISEEDALKEGMAIGCMINNEARLTFNQLWNDMHPGSWRANDWVWVTEFTILSTTGKPELIIKN